MASILTTEDAKEGRLRIEAQPESHLETPPSPLQHSTLEWQSER